MSKAHLLIVDDEPDIRTLVQEILEDEGYKVVSAGSAQEARQACRAARPDLVLLDVWMPDTDGISLLKEWQQLGMTMPVVMMSGHGTIETAVEATRLGAVDFLEKPLSLAKLLVTVERHLELVKVRQENEGLKRQRMAPLDPLGSSRLMQGLRAQAERVASHDTPVLITGEPGSGKCNLARFLHAHSPRSEGPYVEFQPSSVEREGTVAALFGSEDGETVRYGLLEQARGGTLYIDEITQLDSDQQRRLASALSRSAYSRVGGAQPLELGARVIASSSLDLEPEVRSGKLNEDLYYQLKVVPLSVPALRERPEDIPELLAFYADWFHTQERLPYRRFGIAAQNRLRQHGWPGNVRELTNLVQRLLIMGQGDEVDGSEAEQALGMSVVERPAVGGGFSMDLNVPLREAREQFEREYLLRQLKAAQGSVGKLAKLVGLERTHLYRKLRSLGVDLKD
ncbi:MAG: sigma-54-dependent Fis family transcriptional regulator [Xanthomonadales bacterium]|nr:sigma-54-dependent Fis family transcriptional regulator [Xanthomonadales bacterium]